MSPTLPTINYDYFFYQFFSWLERFGLFTFTNSELVFTGYQYVYWLKILLAIVGIAAGVGIVDLLQKIYFIRQKDYKYLLENLLAHRPSDGKPKNAQWEKVQKLISSPNPSDWQAAIIEADKMLFDLLGALGHNGQGIGDRLLAVEPGEMKSLNEAWEAHKYRNRLAHEKGIIVSEHDAKRAITLYEKVFREFSFV